MSITKGQFEPKDNRFVEKVRESFAAQTLMQFIGATITRVEAGEVEIELPYRTNLTQQNGYLHAGIVTTIADSACGYAAFSLMPEKADVLTVEYKVNLLSPAIGDLFVATARVLRAGRTLSVVQSDVLAISENNHKQVATMLATVMCLESEI